jgi:protein O-mannosyl-transferase
MAGKTNKKIPAHSVRPEPAKMAINSKSQGTPGWAIFALLIFTAILYSRALSNGITFMDDDYYILNNYYLRDFSLKGVYAIFSHFYSYNYHPLTTFTNLLEYTAFGLNPLPYHLFNVLLHVLNTWLAYKVAEQLSGKTTTALIVAILFAVHPMHVESVAWLSERKDVLYSAFYLGAVLSYLKYIKTGYKSNLYFITIGLFVGSLFSKSAAVTLPVLLVAVDVYKGRAINTKSLLEKIPFLLLSILFGILAIMSQSAGGALKDLSQSYDVITRVFLFTSAISSYLIRLVAPVGLSAIHFFPDLHGGSLPWYYYLSLPFLGVLTWLALRKSSYRKEVIFGVSFFLITISIMLQIVAVGNALTAERYTYLPYIGLFYIAGQWIAGMETTKMYYNILGVFCVFALIFSIQTWSRIGVWQNSDVLFTDVTEHDPGNWRNCFVHYYWGVAKHANGDMNGAIDEYGKAIALKADYTRAYSDRGIVFEELGDFKSALADYKKAVYLDSTHADLFNYRGWAYFKTGDTALAFRDFRKSAQLNPRYAPVYNNMGWVYNQTGDTAAAMQYYNKAIEVDPRFDKPYLNRAAMKANANDAKGAIDDYSTVIKLFPDNNLAYLNRGITRMNLRDMNRACEDLRKAAGLGNAQAKRLADQYCK